MKSFRLYVVVVEVCVKNQSGLTIGHIVTAQTRLKHIKSHTMEVSQTSMMGNLRKTNLDYE